MKSNPFLLALISLMGICCHASAQNLEWYQYPQEQEVRDNLKEWQDLKFGMFIHWGTYTQIPTVESWSICPEQVSWQMNARPAGSNYFEYLKMYENLPKTFNPVDFNPDKWADAAKDAGLKYVVFTTKHHDGFCMYDTQQTDYKITSEDCPFHTNPKANIAAAVFDAFRSKGLKAGAYLSVADWHNDDYWWRFLSPKDRYLNYNPEKYPEKYENFVKFLDAQVDELTSGKYGDITLLWLDLCEISETYKIDYPWERIAATARKNQPGVITVARGTHGIYENYHTAEQKLPKNVILTPWEACMTMSQGWVFRKNPVFKSTANLLELLVTIVSRGGNFLLGIGPGPQGDFEDEIYARLSEIGDWMDVNSEGIYDTHAIEPYENGNLHYTAKDGFIYAFYIPSEESQTIPSEITLEGIKGVKGATMLGSKTSLKAKSKGDSTVVSIPERLRKNLPCNHIWCLKLKVS